MECGVNQGHEDYTFMLLLHTVRREYIIVYDEAPQVFHVKAFKDL